MSVFNDSVLVSTKKLLGLDQDYFVFDLDIITDINSVFGTLHQLGVGPDEQFSISDESAVWSDFLTEGVEINEVKTYVFLRVKLLFDPPSSSFVLNSYKEQIKELEWRLQCKAEEVREAQA